MPSAEKFLGVAAMHFADTSASKGCGRSVVPATRERDLAEISAPEMFPGERLIVCRNRELATERQRKREELLTATERDLARIQAQVRRKHAPLRGAAAIGMAVGAVVNSRKVGKHFTIEIGDSHLTVQPW